MPIWDGIIFAQANIQSIFNTPFSPYLQEGVYFDSFQFAYATTLGINTLLGQALYIVLPFNLFNSGILYIILAELFSAGTRPPLL